MPVQFDPGPAVTELVRRTEHLIQDVVLPIELAHQGSAHDASEDVRRQLQDAAREAKVFAPHVDTEFGGLGLDMRDRAPVFEAAGYSLFGPLALNCAAPDEGNMHLLEKIATSQQKERFLRPLAAGDVRSCFAMTEPVPGAGSDPSALATTAQRTSAGWLLNGRKWFITGAHNAGFAIVMARTSGEPGSRGGATMFLVDAGAPGFQHVRNIDTLDESMFGGHSELALDNIEVGHDAILGELDRGFEYAQVRLGPARTTHCMRWLGTARRAADLAAERAATRQAFGGRLGDLGMVQQLLADNEIDIEASRTLILKTCWDLDTGAPAGHITSITKTFVAEAVNRVVDRALQICGALGVSGDAALSRLYREVRPFRIYDGPSETHRWSIGRRIVRRALTRLEARP
ncbi:acyl-CoA dehydrogenase family protein [Saccharopolyspora mangrovi]|uniref:Acyl-CoA dehydrogenase family protein n=1 Tax=Saccharopolyspora mangrovi TaxID=3082379 RepID=A0ABU6AIF3_9PSEU|nr:acyl-CoA dehydrogenase family protein [Saccharopolyspora sp. S2-29]MEB3371347.1 acyl-CoA dehydrogenase family protein [Saccharopolyspora sp. S2-29]